MTGKIARPGTIWVYDFAATPADIPADSALAAHAAAGATPQTAAQIAAGRQLGAEIASQLVAQINSMGMTAAVAGAAATPQINDIVIRGYLVSVQQGNEPERLAIGFGEGASELKTAVEGFQITPQGLRKLGSGSLDSGGSKSPGAAVGVVGDLQTCAFTDYLAHASRHLESPAVECRCGPTSRAR